MSISLYFKQFDEQKVDQAWDEIAAGTLEKKLEAEKEELIKELQKFEGADLTIDDYDFYSPAADKESVAEKEELIRKKSSLASKKFDVERLISSIKEVRNLVGIKPLAEVDSEIVFLDEELIRYFSADQRKGDFSEYMSPFWEDLVVIFKIVLGIDLSQKYEQGDRIDLIPQEVWEQFFKTINKNHFAASKGKIDDVDYFIENLQYIRDVLKLAIDTKTRFIANIEGDMQTQEPFKTRAAAIYQKLKLASN